VEAEAAAWWETLADLVAELAPRDVAGIAITGITRTQVLTDAAGAPVRPAQCFLDGRAGAEARDLAGSERGTWTAMTPYHPLARLAWAARQDGEAFARVRFVFQPKDFLAFRLTGEAACDPIANAWEYERATGRRRGGLFSDLMPAALDPGARIGRVRGLPGLAGVAVFMASMDTWCATIGAGAARAGDAYIISGTTDAAGAFAPSPVDRPGRVTLPWGSGLFHMGGPSNAGGDSAVWAADLLGLPDVAALVDLAGQAAADAPRLLFVPHLSGARAPLWQPGLRGAFLGLDRAHGPADLARAVLEGVALADRNLLDGLDFCRAIIAGGGARADLWCQIRADALGVPLLRAAAEEPGLLGAAACAFVGLGVFPDFTAAQDAMARPARRFDPDPAAATRLSDAYAWFVRAAASGTPP
jgi:xylulokinase